LTTLDAAAGEHAHLYPQILPGGRGILFTLRLGRDFADVEASNIVVLDPATGKRRTVLEGASLARYGAGHLIFVRGTSLFAVPFDLSRLATTGQPVPLAGEVAVDPSEGIAYFAVSPAGTLAFLDGPVVRTPTTTVLRLDRQGKETALALPPAPYYFPRVSPDGKRLALVRLGGLPSTIVIYDRQRQILSTLTPESGRFICPVWSPDGKRLAFGRTLTQRATVGVKNADGTGEPEAPAKPSGDAELPSSWSPDGKTIAYTVTYVADRSPTRRRFSQDIWLMPMDGSRSPSPWFETPFREAAPAFSPDGRWVAYVSDGSGAPEIYARAYPGPGGPIKVSTESGVEPVWSRGGREIVYRAGPHWEKFMSVEVRDSSAFEASPARPLFSSNVSIGGDWIGGGNFERAFREYDVSADGNEIFATRIAATEEPTRQLHVVTNWAPTVGP
jgi:serine/threonine-protein kinase